ncbi:MAG: hypothetical protein HC837_05995 [Chloroflexaceae bacterium]|nr:hypothetical protein [Chloroflexaceae bacterium]
MQSNIFEQFIESIESKPQWTWERRAGDQPEDDVWVAWSHKNGGKSGLVRLSDTGYRASLCVAYPLQHDDESQASTTIEMAVAHESPLFLTANEAMVWVEHQAWELVEQLLRLCGATEHDHAEAFSRSVASLDDVPPEEWTD